MFLDIAVINDAISEDDNIRSKLARSTFNILPFKDNTA